MRNTRRLRGCTSIPYLGNKRLDKLQVKEIRQWLNQLTRTCQCCDQGKDAARPEDKRRCCAVGEMLPRRSFHTEPR